MLRFLLICVAMLVTTTAAQAQSREMQQFPEERQIEAPMQETTGQRLRIVDVFVPGTGLVQLVIRENEVLTGEFIPVSAMSRNEILQSQFAEDQGIPQTTVVIDNETITVIQLTFPDGSVVFVVIHKATGTMTVITDPEGP